jgi:hypothetical protein
MSIETLLALTISIVSTLTAIGSVYIAIQATKHARNSVRASIFLELMDRYSTKEMNEAIHYLKKLESDHKDEFEVNRYSFARKYLETISPTSPEWQMRRQVSHFYTYVASLIERGLIDEDAVFGVWGADQFSIIEFLEPIETVIGEKYYMPLGVRDWHDIGWCNTEWVALRLLHRGRKWQEKRQKGVDYRFTMPYKRDIYERSFERLNIKEAKVSERENKEKAA